MKVLRFSVGFGKPLWSYTDKLGTEFSIAPIPLGGYVKMLDQREGEVKPEELEQAFNNKTVWQRIAIASAGSEQLQLLEPDNDWLHWDMQGYTASVRAFSPGSKHANAALISNPRGHLLSHWQGPTPALQDTQAMQYAKGIALLGNQGWISAGAGELWHWQNSGLTQLSKSVKAGIWWENHLHGRIV